MLYMKETDASPSQVIERLETAAKDNQFGVLALHNLKDKMNAKGVEFDCDCIVLEVCNPVQAQKVLLADMSISTALPCRISVYQENGKTKMATLLPTALFKFFNAPDLEPVAKEVEETLIRIIDTACA
ncbi:MAG: DUF302 domain-containing protein [Phycisphaerae bacterium]|nr:DUF302 domain-containing protein [Phycisphaerae bacterium]